MMGWEFPPEGASPVWLFGKLAAGRVALVDDADFDLVRQFPWTLQEDTREGRLVHGPYAVTRVITLEGKVAPLAMHKLLTRWALTDHINHDTLDNRRANLRPASATQNSANRRKGPGKTSKYKGVHWNGRDKTWVASIGLNGRKKHLGRFADEESAARAYDTAALDAWGEYAHLNFPLTAHPAA